MKYLFVAIQILASTFVYANWGKTKEVHRSGFSTRDYNKPWLSHHERRSVRKLLTLLAKTKVGEKLIKKASLRAQEQDKELIDLILPGRTSLTDTTLIRRFNASTPDKVTYHSRSKVYINQDLTVKDALLDLAHELTHFAIRDGFNPYQKGFGVKDFVKSTVEGRGGEVEAYLVECQVFLELFKRHRSNSDKCQLVTSDEDGKLSSEMGKKMFYRLGDHYERFKKHIEKHKLYSEDFEDINDHDAHFISSAYSLPYPLAAVLEYESIMSKVCSNDEKRLQYLMKKRSPASDNESKRQIVEHRQRCAEFTQTSHSKHR